MLHLAGCIILDGEGGFLVLHRATPKRNQWEIPGGKVESGESPEAAAVRELREELGVQVTVVRKLGERSFTEDERDMQYHWFLAEITAGEPRLAEPELYDKFGFLSSITLSRRWNGLSPNLQNFIEEVAQGRIELPGV